MKHTNLPPRRPAASRRIAGHAQQDHILDPYQAQQKLLEARSARNAAPSITTGAGNGWRGRRPLTSSSVLRVVGSTTNFLPAS